MGMFDSVFAPCPKCGEDVEFQSKAGECDLKRYHLSSVPVEIARDLDGEVSKCDCGELVKIITTNPIARVQMSIATATVWD